MEGERVTPSSLSLFFFSLLLFFTMTENVQIVQVLIICYIFLFLHFLSHSSRIHVTMHLGMMSDTARDRSQVRCVQG